MLNGISYVAKSIAYDYPNRQDTSLYIGAASRSFGDCDTCQRYGATCGGHPIGSHPLNVSAVDIDYYTLGPTNNTQRWAGSTEITNIWDNNGQMSLNSNFDVVRTKELFLRLIDLFPACQIASQVDIKNAVLSEASVQERLLINSKVSGDIGTTYNHHTHLHFKPF